MSNNDRQTQKSDIVEILSLLWGKRKRIITNCFIGGLLSLIVAFSIPKEYTSTVVMAPELSSSSIGLSSGMSALASMAGIDLGSDVDADAIYPELYPQIVSSTPFLRELASIRVSGMYKKKPVGTQLYDYLKNYNRMPWWSHILTAPGKLLKRMSSGREGETLSFEDTDIRNLSRRQQLVLKSLDKKISADVDKGTSVITLKATMQDPEIATQVVETVSDNLQRYIADYRSVKARKDYDFTEQLYNDAKSEYFDAQRRYAEYSDQHQGIVKMQYQIELDRLANEQNLTFGVYNQMAQQLELAKSKVQEQTPVCVVIQPAVVPFKASSPKKMMTGILYVFLAFFGTCAWIILKAAVTGKKMEV